MIESQTQNPSIGCNVLSLHRTKQIDGADVHGENQEIEGKSEKYRIKMLLIKEYGRYSVAYSIVPDMNLG